MKKYETVIDYILMSIQTGNLRMGDLLPSIRITAHYLGVSTLTVYNAYCHLEQMKLVTGKERQGFVVVADANTLDMDLSHNFIFQVETDLDDIKENFFFNNKQFLPEMVQIGALAPSNKYFPNEDLSKCLSRILRKDADLVNNYGFSIALEGNVSPIAVETAKYMYRSRGITVSETEICPTSGATESLLTVMRAIAKHGDMVMIESPCYLSLLTILRQQKLMPIGIETLPPFGLNIEKMEQLLEAGIRPTCIVVTPNFHNPTGSLMPIENRKRLLELCEKYGVIIVEDDTLGSLHFYDIVPSLKSMNPDNVIYVSSYSKVLSPGYRVGWVAGGKYSYKIDITHSFESYSTTIMTQFAVAQYLESGKMKAHLRGLRKIYENNRNLMIELLEKYLPCGTEIFKPLGGQYIWTTLPKTISAGELYFSAKKERILLAPGNIFTKSNDYSNCLRFCYAQEITDKIAIAIETVGKLAAEQVSVQ
jgi:DNA-binding transcriptional MocR family regulator